MRGSYGLWTLVILNSIVFIIFAFSFAKPQSPRDYSTARLRLQERADAQAVPRMKKELQ
jgi:hypothetical protein